MSELLDELKRYGKFYLERQGQVLPFFDFETFSGLKGRQVFHTPGGMTIQDTQIGSLLAGNTQALGFDEKLLEEGKPLLKEMGNDGHLRAVRFFSPARTRQLPGDLHVSTLANDDKARRVIIGVELRVDGDTPASWDADGLLVADQLKYKGITLPIIKMGDTEDLGGAVELENVDPIQITMYFTGWLAYIVENREANEILWLAKQLFTATGVSL